MASPVSLVHGVYWRVGRFINKSRTGRKCYLCGNTFHHFIAYRGGTKNRPLFLKLLDGVGSDANNFWCPYCRCHDRERHLFMYFDKLGLWEKLKGKVLHIAPEVHVRRKIEQIQPELYIKGDLFPASEDIEKVDVTAIQYPDEHFDFILCNHVLEHVPAIEKALSELLRVLKKGGTAILQTPYSNLLHSSFEDPNINTDELRFNLYGQKDHVRIFGHDLFRLIEGAGFHLDLKKHEETLPDLDSRVYGVNLREPLFLASKP